MKQLGIAFAFYPFQFQWFYRKTVDFALLGFVGNYYGFGPFQVQLYTPNHSDEEPQFIKVLLPGEAVWGRVLKEISRDNLLIEIDNDLVNSDGHGFSCGDLVVVTPVANTENWEPAGVSQ